MNITDRLRAVEDEERRAWMKRLEADVSVLATKVATLSWEPGGDMVVRDEIERSEYVESLQRHVLALGDRRSSQEKTPVLAAHAGLRFSNDEKRAPLSAEHATALISDHQAIHRTLRHALHAHATDNETRALLRAIERTLRSGEAFLTRLLARLSKQVPRDRTRATTLGAPENAQRNVSTSSR
jgi:hypothetical protein